MATVSQMRQRFIEFRESMYEHAKAIIDAYEGELVEAVRDQLRQGKDGYDRFLEPEYRLDDYSRFKFGRDGSKAPYGIPDLHLTGSFYNLMAITWFDPTEFSIISNDKKWFNLMKKYGLDTMKLSQANVQYFKINRFNPAFIQAMSDYTGAKAT